MPALQIPAPILYISSEPSFFGIIEAEGKHPTLKDVTRIDFPLIEKGEFQKENLVHALRSLEQKQLYVVVSDEVFFHHISDYATSAQKNIAEEIKTTVSEVFSDKKEPLHIVTVDLAKTSKMQTVQITALTKSNLAILAEAAKEVGLEILSILPASFVVKAFVSVDPSLFVLVTSNSFLLTSHYIGVDFAQNIAKDNVKELTTTIKTLKTERPHIQHVYLCGDPDDITPLHEQLAEVLPVQDVEVKAIETEHDTPFFLKAFILGVKEVIENDFPLPHFSTDIDLAVEKARKEEVTPTDPIKAVAAEMEKEQELPAPTLTVNSKEDEETVGEVTKDETITKTVEEKTEPNEEEEIQEVLAKPVENKSLPKISSTSDEIATLPQPVAAPVLASAVITPAINIVDNTIDVGTEPEPVIAPKTITSPKVILPETSAASSIEAPKTAPIVPKPVTPISTTTETKTATVVDRSTLNSTPVVKVKKKSGIFKYVCLALGVALVISLIGGGIVTSQQALSDKNNSTLQTPLSEVTTTPKEEPTATPEPTPIPVALDELSIGVFNATTIAGRAGKVAAGVKKEGAKTVDAGNAKAKYEEEGNYIMFAKPEFEGAKETLEKATELTLEEMDMNKAENPGDKYDIIIIINE